jgi:hypothetical protein
MTAGTYLYCVVLAPPARRARVRGLPGTGPIRLLDADGGLHLVAADAPLSRYGEAAIKRGLGDLEWVSRAAMAHEQVVESFAGAEAVLPMKLFTIFSSDARALAHVRGEQKRIDAAVKRVAKHDEWSVRVVLDRARTEKKAAQPSASGTRNRTGVAYLARKKARRDAAVELAERARDIVAALYDRLGARARLSRRRSASELPVENGPLLLDAAFLVPRSRTGTFRTLAAREARALARQGYGMTLTGPWPPYSFVQD